MKIIKNFPGWKREQNINGDFVSTILDHVFTITKQDKNFSIHEKSEDIEDKINIINQKIVKQENFLAQANKIETNTSTSIKKIDDQSFILKERILEILGDKL